VGAFVPLAWAPQFFGINPTANISTPTTYDLTLSIGPLSENYPDADVDLYTILLVTNSVAQMLTSGQIT
jgi:hypothetical protein